MKHRVGFNRLSRRQGHLKALKNNMVTSLFRYERVATTKAKALEVRRVAEKMVTRARVDSVHNRRIIGQRIHDQEVLAKLFTDIAPRYLERPGGYTRVLKTGRRQGDAAEMVILELVDRKIEERPVRQKAAEAEPEEAAVEPEETVVEAEEEKSAEEVPEEAPKARVGGTKGTKAPTKKASTATAKKTPTKAKTAETESAEAKTTEAETKPAGAGDESSKPKAKTPAKPKASSAAKAKSDAPEEAKETKAAAAKPKKTASAKPEKAEPSSEEPATPAEEPDKEKTEE